MTKKSSNIWTKILAGIGVLSLVVGILVGAVSLWKEFEAPGKPMLKYLISYTDIVADQDIIKVVEGNSIKYDKTKDYPILGNSTIKDSGIYKIVIKNTGDKELKQESFYPADPLRICVENYYSVKDFYVYIDQPEEEKYMNPRIEKVKDNCIFLSFDAWEPDSELRLNILSLYNFQKIKIIGKTTYFDKISPINYETAKQFGTFEEQRELDPNDPVKGMFYIVPIAIILIIITGFLFDYSERGYRIKIVKNKDVKKQKDSSKKGL
ncbi:MAG: hypothetical protein LBR41_00780 [Rickettsiales bacterium]|jgi:hypothetical protein|nr:hypothetical protein [Rickettsiales bacterium]